MSGSRGSIGNGAENNANPSSLLDSPKIVQTLPIPFEAFLKLDAGEAEVDRRCAEPVVTEDLPDRRQVDPLSEPALPPEAAPGSEATKLAEAKSGLEGDPDEPLHGRPARVEQAVRILGRARFSQVLILHLQTPNSCILAVGRRSQCAEPTDADSITSPENECTPGTPGRFQTT